VKKKYLLLIKLCVAFGINTFAQLEELTPVEQAYRDSIKALNLQNEAVAQSQEAYNRGIKFLLELSIGINKKN